MLVNIFYNFVQDPITVVYCGNVCKNALFYMCYHNVRKHIKCSAMSCGSIYFEWHLNTPMQCTTNSPALQSTATHRYEQSVHCDALCKMLQLQCATKLWHSLKMNGLLTTMHIECACIFIMYWCKPTPAFFPY